MWDREWFMILKPKLKCLVKYVRDKCNMAGVWSPNWTLASIHIGEEVIEKDLLDIDAGEQFLKTREGKIFCRGFIEFQYGIFLNEKSPVHRKIIDLLKKYHVGNVTLLDMLPNRVCNTPKEEDKEEEEEVKEFGKSENLLPATNSNGQPETKPVDGIVHDMVSDFKKAFPSYPIDKEKDLHACMQIAWRIAEEKGIKKADVTGKKAIDIRRRWGEIIEFIASDTWYSTKSLTFLRNNWQDTMQKFAKYQPAESIGSGYKKSAREIQDEKLLDSINGPLKK